MFSSASGLETKAHVQVFVLGQLQGSGVSSVRVEREQLLSDYPRRKQGLVPWEILKKSEKCTPRAVHP